MAFKINWNYLINTNQEAEEVTFCKVLTVFPIFFFQGHMMSNAGSFISCQELIRSGYLLTKVTKKLLTFLNQLVPPKSKHWKNQVFNLTRNFWSCALFIFCHIGAKISKQDIQWCSYQNHQSPVYDMEWGHFDRVNCTFKILLSSWNFDKVFK